MFERKSSRTHVGEHAKCRTSSLLSGKSWDAKKQTNLAKDVIILLVCMGQHIGLTI